MWGPIVRPFGRALNYIAFSVAVLVCAIATILVDARMYLSAGFFGLLGATGLVLFGVHLLRDLREARERKRELEAAERRSQARSERIDRAKATVADAARTATSSAAKVAGRAKAKVAGAFKRARFWERKNRPE
jgi:hypothetical protein